MTCFQNESIYIPKNVRIVYCCLQLVAATKFEIIKANDNNNIVYLKLQMRFFSAKNHVMLPYSQQFAVHYY